MPRHVSLNKKQFLLDLSILVEMTEEIVFLNFSQFINPADNVLISAGVLPSVFNG